MSAIQISALVFNEEPKVFFRLSLRSLLQDFSAFFAVMLFLAGSAAFLIGAA